MALSKSKVMQHSTHLRKENGKINDEGEITAHHMLNFGSLIWVGKWRNMQRNELFLDTKQIDTFFREKQMRPPKNPDFSVITKQPSWLHII